MSVDLNFNININTAKEIFPFKVQDTRKHGRVYKLFQKLLTPLKWVASKVVKVFTYFTKAEMRKRQFKTDFDLSLKEFKTILTRDKGKIDLDQAEKRLETAKKIHQYVTKDAGESLSSDFPKRIKVITHLINQQKAALGTKETEAPTAPQEDEILDDASTSSDSAFPADDLVGPSGPIPGPSLLDDGDDADVDEPADVDGLSGDEGSPTVGEDGVNPDVEADAAPHQDGSLQASDSDDDLYSSDGGEGTGLVIDLTDQTEEDDSCESGEGDDSASSSDHFSYDYDPYSLYNSFPSSIEDDEGSEFGSSGDPTAAKVASGEFVLFSQLQTSSSKYAKPLKSRKIVPQNDNLGETASKVFSVVSKLPKH